jgi:nucleoside diphosphate kinase
MIRSEGKITPAFQRYSAASKGRTIGTAVSGSLSTARSSSTEPSHVGSCRLPRFSEALYIIKPHAFARRAAIRAGLKEAGTQIASYRAAALSERAICALYPDIRGTLRRLSVRDLSIGLCEIGILRRTGSIDSIVATTGPRTNPSECGNATMRRRFGRRAPTRIGTVRYFHNAIHCSRDQREFHADLRMLQSLKRLQKQRLGRRGK